MKNDVRQGALLLLAGEAFLAIMAALVKTLGDDLPQETLLFARNVFGLLALIPFLVRSGHHNLRTHRLGLHFLRAAFGVTAMHGFFYVITELRLAEAVLVKLSTPFWLPLVAYWWLRERISAENLLAILVGFAGVLFILRPGTAYFEPAALIGIGAAFLAALAKVCIRKMSDTEPSDRIVFYFAVFSTLIAAIPLSWGWKMPEGEQWLILALIGLCGTLGQLLMTQAYRVAKPGQVGPYTYASLVYASLLGWWFWDESLLASTLIGSLLIVTAGLLNLHRFPALTRWLEARKRKPLP